MKKFFSLLLLPILAFGQLTIKNGIVVEKVEEVGTGSGQEFYATMLKSFEAKEWKRLSQDCLLLLEDYAGTPFAKEANYFLGVAYFQMEDYEMANVQFTDYLTSQATPRFFEETIQYKFAIAEKFRNGSKKHLMGFKALPRWQGAGSEAIEIYNEVVSALPNHDLSARSLFGKAELLAKRDDFRAAIETYQTLIRRFPKHPLAIESYIGIGEVYLQQSRAEYADPDYIELAELNLRKFKKSFPNEEKLAVAQELFDRMRDHYALSLYETARFYERTKRWGAAKIYYQKIVQNFPNSESGRSSHERLPRVEKKLAAVDARKNT